MTTRQLTMTTSDRMRICAGDPVVTLQASDDGCGGILVHLAEPFNVLIRVHARLASRKTKYVMFLPENVHVDRVATHD